MPHSLCSDAASVPANRRCALQSSAWAVLRTRSLGLSPQSLAQCDGVLVPGVGRIPTRSTRHGSWHPPISSSAANAPPAAPGAVPSHRRGPECRLRAHVHRGSGPAYRPRYAAFCRLFSSRIISARPPFSVVLTVWLSRIAVLGSGCLSTERRTCRRNASWTRCHVPSKRQVRK